jgi:hypothetical protein
MVGIRSITASSQPRVGRSHLVGGHAATTAVAIMAAALSHHGGDAATGGRSPEAMLDATRALLNKPLGLKSSPVAANNGA